MFDKKARRFNKLKLDIKETGPAVL